MTLYEILLACSIGTFQCFGAGTPDVIQLTVIGINHSEMQIPHEVEVDGTVIKIFPYNHPGHGTL